MIIEIEGSRKSILEEIVVMWLILFYVLGL